jgi:DNA polymerase III subunit gamma/tau
MSKVVHTALYRAYRPQTFGDVRGQDHVVKVLQAAIKGKKIGHAYLFAGSRGTGKTSVARIFARDIGCTEKDLYEIDAASNRGIDDIRELREGVHVFPFESPYKVYIIDEAHMLTKEAWNALLKTLEEPPPHAVFVLATTEKHKVPDTIQSRCEVYTFKQPSREMLAQAVIGVAKKEKFAIEQSGADLIALLAEGSFRDALGILQKVLTISKNKKVDIKEIEEVTGAPKGALVRVLIEALAEKNTHKAIKIISEAVEENMDIRILTKLLMHRVRAVILLRYAPEMEKQISEELSEEDLELAKKLSRDKEMLISSNTLKILLDAYSTMTYAAIVHLPLELAVMDLTTEEK